MRFNSLPNCTYECELCVLSGLSSLQYLLCLVQAVSVVIHVWMSFEASSENNREAQGTCSLFFVAALPFNLVFLTHRNRSHVAGREITEHLLRTLPWDRRPELNSIQYAHA